MNSVPNSDSEQCTESKLSRVHNAPTLGPACAHAACLAGRVVVHQAPCRRPGPAMYQRTPDRVARCASNAVSPRPRVRCCAYRSSLRRIVALPPAVSHLSLDTSCWPYRGPCCASVPLACHDIIYCIVTQGWKMGSSPSSFLALFFFSTSFCSTYWKATNFFFFSFSSRTK